jgi:hypothetical protein
MAVVGFAFMANVQVYALSSALDIDQLKEEIKEELRTEGPWSDEIDAWGIDIHGFVSQGYLCSTDYNYLANDSEGGSFQFNEIGINFAKDLTEKLRIGIQILSRDLGDLYNNELEIDWAYADYRWKDWLGLRAGILKVPLGFYNETRDVDMLRTFVLLPSGVYHETYRDYSMGLSGAGIYGAVPIGAAGDLDYVMEAGTLNLDADDSGIAKVYADEINRGWNASGLGTFNFEIDDIDVDEVYVGSLQWRSPWGLRLGTSVNYSTFVAQGADSINNATANLDSYECRTYTLSAEYIWEDLIIAIEYWNNMIETKSTFLNMPVLGTVRSDEKAEIEGYYISASYRVNEWLELGSYYSMYYADASDHDGDDVVGAPDHKAWTEDIALATRFDINEYWIFKIEGHRMNGTAVVVGSDNDNSFPDQRWWLLAAKITFSF